MIWNNLVQLCWLNNDIEGYLGKKTSKIAKKAIVD